MASGMLYGLLGVLIFSATLPMTRLAVADLHPVFIAIGRSAVAEAGGLTWGDASLLLAVPLGALGYARGAVLSRRMDGEVVISWALVLVLPLSVGVILWSLLDGWAFVVPPADVGVGAWLAFLYVSVFSMWIGFSFWYRGLAAGGVARVSQTQLLQPFFSVLIAALMLGEALSSSTVGFAIAVIATVAIGRRMQVAT